jgi:hypothetical protein
MRKSGHRILKAFGGEEYVAVIKRHRMEGKANQWLVHYYLDDDHPVGNTEWLDMKQIASGLALAQLRKCDGPKP